MYRILDGSEKGIVAIKVEGKLNREEYELLNAYVDQRMQEGQVLNFLCDLVEVDGLKSQVVWEEMTRHLRNLLNSQRIAVVGGRRWLESGTIVFEPSLKDQLKFFHSEQADAAWLWVKKPEGSP